MAAQTLPNLIARFNASHNSTHSTSNKWRIIVGVIVGVILILLIAVAVFFVLRRRRNARRGTKLRDMGEAERDEEAKSMVRTPARAPSPMRMQEGDTSYPSQTKLGEGTYAEGGYGQAAAHDPAGQQGTEFYRNQ